LSKLKLTDLLITPVQRIPRYQLLLGPIVKLTPPTHPDFASLSKAAEEMRKLAEQINEKKREADARIKVVEIQSKIAGDFPVRSLLAFVVVAD